jgi:ankyrin repeat protein
MIVLNKDRLILLKSASSNRYIKVVKLLLKKGADIIVTNKKG